MGGDKNGGWITKNHGDAAATTTMLSNSFYETYLFKTATSEKLNPEVL
jgi:hypothetical protein